MSSKSSFENPYEEYSANVPNTLLSSSKDAVRTIYVFDILENLR